MRSTNCRTFQSEIDEADLGQPFSERVMQHIKTCGECRAFSAERHKLRLLVGDLGTVEAPQDFDFRLRARLARYRTTDKGTVAPRNLSLGVRSVAVASVALIILAAALVVKNRVPERRESQPGLVVKTPAPETGGPSHAPSIVNKPNVATAGRSKAASNGARALVTQRRFTGRQPKGLQAVATSAPTKRGTAIRELSGSAAAVVKRETALVQSNGSILMPVDSPQAFLKLSLDDGRGSARIISLPAVSFGSQRLVPRNAPAVFTSGPKNVW